MSAWHFLLMLSTAITFSTPSVTPPTVTGNLAWVMQLWFDAYRFTMDNQVLHDLYPLLRRTVNFYLHYTTTNATDGSIHMPETYSPEYASAADCNYDNALLRNAVTSLVYTIEILQIDDPRLSDYKTLAENLTPPPQGALDSEYPGFWIGKDVPLKSGHRHFSHLFAIFPLKQLAFEGPSKDLATASVDYWLGMTDGLTGFCRTAASSMNVLFGRRQAALTNLTYLLDSYILPNTFYHEGENGECGETPPAATSAIQDWMLLQWSDLRGEAIHVFAGT